MPADPAVPDTALRARDLYAEGASLIRIRAETGLYSGNLYTWLDGRAAASAGLPPLTRRRVKVVGQRRRALTGSRPSLIARLWRTAERQVADIETRLLSAGGDPAALERDAKTLAVLARTVHALVALDTAAARGTEMDRPDDEPQAPRDLDAFRQDLAEKLAQLGALEAGD